MIATGRHRGQEVPAVTLDFAPVTFEDYEQDIAAVGEEALSEHCHFLLSRRWEGFSNVRTLAQAKISRRKGSTTRTNASVSEPIPEKSIWYSDSSSCRAHTWGDPQTSPDYIVERLSEGMTVRFNPELVKVRFQDQNDPRIAKAVECVRGSENNEPAFAHYMKALEETTGKKRDLTGLAVDAFNAIAWRLHGRSVPPFFEKTPQKGMSHNPALRYFEDHGFGLRYDQQRGRPESQKVYPDVFGHKGNHAGLEDLHWGRVRFAGTHVVEAASDCQSPDSRYVQDSPPLDILKFMSFISYENPVNGRVCGYTLCGRFLRLYVSDSLSFRTSILCDLSDPSHALDIVAIVAFLIGPLDSVLETFEPPKDKFSVKPPGDHSEPVEYEWIADPDLKASYPWKVLERRCDLWGRRTVAIGGHARKTGTADPPQAMTMKFTWLPRYLVEYEQTILDKLDKAIQNPDSASKYLQEAITKVDPRVLEARPRPIGMLVGIDKCTSEAPMDIAVEDGERPESSKTRSSLVLSAMCSINPHGHRINNHSCLSEKERLQILAHTFEALWIAACADIHYRDLNAGNILYEMLSELGSEGLTPLVGYLIDYGNARILDQRRIYTRFPESGPETGNVQLRLDDARSANKLFLSTRMSIITAAQENYKSQLSNLKILEAQIEEAPDDCILAEDLPHAQSAVEESQRNLSAAGLHRYIDDMESAIYVHVYQFAMCAGEKATLPGASKKREQISIFEFGNPSVKQTNWDKGLTNTCNIIDNATTHWRLHIRKLARTIASCSQALAKRTDLQASISEEENDCFKACLQILAGAQRDPDIDSRPLQASPKAIIPRMAELSMAPPSGKKSRQAPSRQPDFRTLD